MDGAARLRFLQSLQVFLQGVRRFRTRHETDRLLALLGRIADPELRLHRFGEHLRTRGPEGGVWTIAELWRRVAGGERLAQALWLGMLDANRLGRVLGADCLKALAAVLDAAGEPCAGLFLPPRVRPDLPDDETAPRAKEPVGFRIALARRPIPRLLDRLLFDPDARVVRTILGNPRVIEADVVKLAASRRAPAEVLEVIAQDDGWIARYPVKVALANNPRTPLRLVLGLLPYLLTQDLRAVAAASSRAEVRDQATCLLSMRPKA